KTDIVTAHLVKGLRATLFQEIGEPKAGDAAPLTAHWCLALPVAPMSEIGPDGHPTRGGFLPPVPLPRRMWAGGELEFFDTLRVGDETKRASVISDVSMKTGSTGVLCFVSVEHLVTTARGTAIRERHDIVYRDISGAPAAAPAKAQPSPRLAQHSESHMADPVLLFRYSALTFNGHRIHYDLDYVTRIEGYPGLIVHGPLQAALYLLRAFGIKKVFGNPGSTELPFLSDWPDDIDYVLGLQEASVVGMADGYAQATRNAGFVNLHSAAGLGNALGNIYTAHRNQTPLVITAGQQARSILPLQPFLYAERASEFPRPYVKFSVEPARAEDVPAAIARAYYVAMQPPCGPTSG